jgi:hypothetical protein
MAYDTAMKIQDPPRLQQSAAPDNTGPDDPRNVFHHALSIRIDN